MFVPLQSISVQLQKKGKKIVAVPVQILHFYLQESEFQAG